VVGIADVAAGGARSSTTSPTGPFAPEPIDRN
jgi:hypothetical protein